MTGNIKPRYFASRSLDVASVGDDDGLDARAQARPSPDGVGHIQCLPRRHDAWLGIGIGLSIGFGIGLSSSRIGWEMARISFCKTLHSL